MIALAARALREGAELEDDTPRQPGPFVRHDLAALAILVAIFIGGAVAHRALLAPSSVIAEHSALRLAHPGGWLPATDVAAPRPRLAHAALALSGSVVEPDPDAQRAAHRSIHVFPADPIMRVEIEIRRRPPYSNVPAALALARAVRHGERYWTRETHARVIAGRDWYRTGFRYAYGGGRSPRVAEAVEYAAPSGDDLYVITLHGDVRSVAALEREVAPTLTLSTERTQPGARR